MVVWLGWVVWVVDQGAFGGSREGLRRAGVHGRRGSRVERWSGGEVEVERR